MRRDRSTMPAGTEPRPPSQAVLVCGRCGDSLTADLGAVLKSKTLVSPEILQGWSVASSNFVLSVRCPKHVRVAEPELARGQ
jgi:hypothetical protein